MNVQGMGTAISVIVGLGAVVGYFATNYLPVEYATLVGFGVSAITGLVMSFFAKRMQSDAQEKIKRQQASFTAPTASQAPNAPPAGSAAEADAETIGATGAGMDANNMPLMELKMRVTPSDGSPFEGSAKMVTTEIDPAWYQPGTKLRVRYSPDNPTTLFPIR
jgi:hypothetical protein